MRGLPAATSLVLLALGAPAQESRQPLGGGFGRPTATPSPAAPAATPSGLPKAPVESLQVVPAGPPPTQRPVERAEVLRPAVAAPTAPPSGIPASPLPETPPKTTATVSVGYVLVPFVVTDTKGRPVRDLKESDVTLLVDGQSVALDLFERSDDAPVSFTILLDGSGSMGLLGKMNGARECIRALLAHRHPGDDFALYVFARGEMSEVVPFTDDTGRLQRAVDALKPFGKTAFYDALARMPDRSLLGKNGARAIILLTDGLDNASTLTRAELTTILEGVDVPVYSLLVRSPGAPVDPGPGENPESLLDLGILGHVARISGGRLAVLTEPEQLVGAIDAIEKDLRAQYLIGFAPTGRGPVKYHRINLKLDGPARPVRVRAGYRGTEPTLKTRTTRSERK